MLGECRNFIRLIVFAILMTTCVSTFLVGACACAFSIDYVSNVGEALLVRRMLNSITSNSSRLADKFWQ